MINTAPLPKRTPLYNLHAELGAKMVNFAGYLMPIHYPQGIIKEHRHTRNSAGLFDIAHMGQILIKKGKNLVSQLEHTLPADLLQLPSNRMRYSFLLNDNAGILDDIMIVRLMDGPDPSFLLIVNASNKHCDLNHLKNNLPHCDVSLIEDHALIALQGPHAASVLETHCSAPRELKFMQAGRYSIEGIGSCLISRSGYTGEDGFELSVPITSIEKLVRLLLNNQAVTPVGLGARDSLRLEAGLCLHGHDLTTEISPLEADLAWAIPKRRREEGQFIGASVLQSQLYVGVKRKRVGLRPEGRIIAREHTPLFTQDNTQVGTISSGGYSPTLDGPIAMGYVDREVALQGKMLFAKIREQLIPTAIVPLPFVPHNYLKES